MLRGRWLLPGASLALGAGLGAALTARRRAEGREAEGLLGRLPVLPAVAAAAGPPALPGSGRTELTKYGLPGLAQLRSRESYVLCYDPRSRSALWVIEQLNRETLSGTSDRAACDFQEDDSVHEYHRATNADYRGSGFDRGHLAAAANHKWSQKAMRDTFYLSNIAPQVGIAAGTGSCVCITPPAPPGPGEGEPELPVFKGKRWSPLETAPGSLRLFGGLVPGAVQAERVRSGHRHSGPPCFPLNLTTAILQTNLPRRVSRKPRETPFRAAPRRSKVKQADERSQKSWVEASGFCSWVCKPGPRCTQRRR